MCSTRKAHETQRHVHFVARNALDSPRKQAVGQTRRSLQSTAVQGRPPRRRTCSYRGRIAAQLEIAEAAGQERLRRPEPVTCVAPDTHAPLSSTGFPVSTSSVRKKVLYRYEYQALTFRQHSKGVSSSGYTCSRLSRFGGTGQSAGSLASNTVRQAVVQQTSKRRRYCTGASASQRVRCHEHTEVDIETISRKHETAWRAKRELLSNPRVQWRRDAANEEVPARASGPAQSKLSGKRYTRPRVHSHGEIRVLKQRVAGYCAGQNDYILNSEE